MNFVGTPVYDRLVADHIARNGVTLCPPGAVAIDAADHNAHSWLAVGRQAQSAKRRQDRLSRASEQRGDLRRLAPAQRGSQALLRRERIAKMIADGVRREDIAKREGITRRSLVNILCEMRKSGWDIPHGGRWS